MGKEALSPPSGVRTTCPYCGVGCGIRATPDGLGGASIAGDPKHPANFGRLCSKGAALGETLGLENRLLRPMLGDREVDWEQALSHIAAGLGRIRDQHGPEAIAFYLSGQLLTEDYYVANKLAKGFIGTPHVDTNSRLCMASTVAGHRRAFGADVVPQNYADLELADLVVLAGSNAAWCHPSSTSVCRSLGRSAAPAWSRSIRAAPPRARVRICTYPFARAPTLSSGTACWFGSKSNSSLRKPMSSGTRRGLRPL
jgi:anaerobic selenocysteine-containing dehydrogenase